MTMDPNQQNIMTQLGFDKLPVEKQEELYKRIGVVLFQGIMLRALESMSDEEQDKLDAFLGEHPEDPDALMGYLRQNVTDFDALVADEVARFRASVMDLPTAPIA